MAFDQFPYSNFHELNADWLLQEIKSAADRVEAALAVIDGVESQITALQNADAQLRQELSAISASLSQMGTVVSRHTSEITALQQADASLHSDLQDVRTELINTEQRLRAVEVSVYRGLWPALAERYTAYEAYNVGDIVYAASTGDTAPKIWRCVTAHTGPVAFDPTKWQQVTMVELLDMVSATATDDVTDLFTVTGIGPYYLRFAPSNMAALAARMNAHRICYIHYLTTHFIVKSVEYRDGADAPQYIEVYITNSTSVSWNFNGHSSTTPIDPTSSQVLASQTYVNNRMAQAAMRIGSYPYLAAGDLISSDGQTDRIPYLERTVPADASNRMELKKVVGGTVVRNQLAALFRAAWTLSLTTISFSAETVTMTVSSAGTIKTAKLNTNNGHVYLMDAYIKSLTAFTSRIGFFSSAGGTLQIIDNSTDQTTEKHGVKIYKTQSDDYFAIRTSNSAPVGSVVEVRNLMLIDITQMFGATIADYIYSLETATDGAGVAWLRQYFPQFFSAGYLPYNAGELVSVSGLVSHDEYDTDGNLIKSYPLDSSLTLRGILKLDASNRPYFDGDEYLPSGDVTRRYGVRAYQSGDESLADAITDGTTTVYKLTNPTTDSANPYIEEQACAAGGKEQFVIDSHAGLVSSVGNVSLYPQNLAKKIENIPAIPTAPAADGTYALKATVSGGVVTYFWA